MTQNVCSLFFQLNHGTNSLSTFKVSLILSVYQAAIYVEDK